MNINFTDEAKGSLCYYIAYDKDNKVISSRSKGNCHGYKVSISSFKKYSLLFDVSTTVVTIEEIQSWLNFCASCGFPSDKVTIEALDKVGYPVISGNFYVVNLDMDNYVSPLHLFAAVTVIRMISYRASDGRFVKSAQSIIKNVCKLINESPDIQPLDALLRAHNEEACYNHFLISKDYFNTCSTFKDVEDMLNHFKSGQYSTLNDFFSKINPKNFI